MPHWGMWLACDQNKTLSSANIPWPRLSGTGCRSTEHQRGNGSRRMGLGYSSSPIRSRRGSSGRETSETGIGLKTSKLISTDNRGSKMKVRTFILGVLLFVFAAVSFATAAGKKPTDEVRKASEQFYAALNRMLNGDAGPMADIWSHSAVVTTMHPIGGREVGWAMFEDHGSKWPNWPQTGRLD